jgi:outer membrane protein TolC
MRIRLIALMFATALTSCSVGPDFERPKPPVAVSYLAKDGNNQIARDEPEANVGAGPAERWWNAFGSADLDALVDRAIAQNPNLAVSNATLDAARAELRAIAGRRLPQLDGNARIEREQINLSAFGFARSNAIGVDGNPEFPLYSVGGGISYDLDIFG